MRDIVSYFLIAFSIANSAWLSGCISMKVGAQATKADAVRFSEPKSPFSVLQTNHSDHAWQNSGNGNTISYLSQCQDQADPSLTSLRGEILAGLDQSNVVSEEMVTYNGREALDVIADGKIDGVPTRIHVRIFKKNSCIFTISYIGTAKNFLSDHKAFQGFLDHLVVR